VLSDDDNGLLKREITENELYDTLKCMHKNKSPGPDGIPVEFYLEFWNDIKRILLDVYIESYENEELSCTQRQSIMCLIFKKSLRELFKNYRPLSLSNTDYKLIAYLWANRLQKFLKNIISNSQSAYIKGRFIGENIRFLLDVIEYAESEQLPGILLFLDFEKAFDSLNWSFIIKCLEKIGFGEKFIKWFKTLYKNQVAYVKINNYFTRGVHMKRGVKQGCPLSALIFIICTEILYQAINSQDSIKGFLLPDNSEIKISQYADDTCIFLRNEDSIDEVIKHVKEFGKISGLILNVEKREILLIWLLKQTNLENKHNVKWPEDPIRYLGIYIGNNYDICYKKNWSNKLDDMQKLIDCWIKHKISLFG